MLITRRLLLQQFGAGAALATAPALTRAASAAGLSPASTAPAVRRPVRLHKNESPFAPPARVRETLRDAVDGGASKYPDAEIDTLQHAIADMHAVRPEQIVLGCGSSEILRTAACALSGPGRKVLLASPTFDLIGRCAIQAGAEAVSVPLTPNHAHDLDAMLTRVDEATRLVYICNPNNPTGSLTPRKDIEAFIERLPATTHVLIDEAYHHYVSRSADYASFIDRPIDNPRVIVTRSLSSVYGLAALRVGYAVTSEETARTLVAHGLPDSVSALAARGAVAALSDRDYVRVTAEANANWRQEFWNQANARMLKGIDSQTNFMMVNTLRPAADVVTHFRDHDVLIAGPFASYPTYVRVSLGTSDDMQVFWHVWDMKYKHMM
jgi:histidinol-phosphate aminotransferase